MRLALALTVAGGMRGLYPGLPDTPPVTPPPAPMLQVIGAASLSVTGLLGALLPATKNYTLPVPGVKMGETLTVDPQYVPPVGWVINSISAPANDQVVLNVSNPALSLNLTTVLNVPILAMR